MLAEYLFDSCSSQPLNSIGAQCASSGVLKMSMPFSSTMGCMRFTRLINWSCPSWFIVIEKGGSRKTSPMGVSGSIGIQRPDIASTARTAVSSLKLNSSMFFSRNSMGR